MAWSQQCAAATFRVESVPTAKNRFGGVTDLHTKHRNTQTLMISHYSCWEGVRAQLSWVLRPGVSPQASVKLSASRVLICRLDWVGNLLLSSLLRLWLGGEHAVSCGL